MVLALSRLSRFFYPLEADLLQTKRVPFQTPIFPHYEICLKNRMIVPMRTFGSCPFPPNGSDQQFTLVNLNFSSDQERKMNEFLQCLKNSGFQKVCFERGSLICSMDWVQQLLSQTNLIRIDLIAHSDQTETSTRFKLANPEAKDIQRLISLWQHRPKRPRQSIITEIDLSKKGMLRTLSDLMSSTSHAMSFEWIKKKPPTSE